MQKLFKVVLIVCCGIFSLTLFADEAGESEEMMKVKTLLEMNVPNMQIESISKSKMPGVYEVLTSGQLLYVSEDAKFLISGKLFSIESGIRDLTAESMQAIDMKVAPQRREKVSNVDSKDMIIFKADDEKYRVTVFTDVDCAYCRKLHMDMEDYNDLGITIQYLGFPRAGLGSPSHKKLQTVWCAADPLAAMDKAKKERKFGTNSCDDPLAEHMKLVRAFNLTGTPALILESGQYISGYMKAEQLLAIVKEDKESLANSVETVN